MMLLPLVPLLLALVWIAAGDLRSRRIPNYLTLPLLLAGFAQAAMGQTVSPGQSLAGFAVGFGLTLPLMAMDALKGGDVKLMAAVGAWLGPGLTLAVFAAAAVVGMVIVLVQAVWQRRLAVLCRNSALLACSLARTDQYGVQQAMEMGPSFRSVKYALPYGVSVLFGTLLVLAHQWR